MSWTTPPVFTTGEVFTATAANELFGSGGDLSYLYGDVNWSTVSAFANGWVTTGACAYRKVGSLVQLRGGLISGSANTTAFTLPAGYRPSSDLTLPTGIPFGGYTPVVVLTTGDVQPFTSPGNGVALDGIIYSADV